MQKENKKEKEQKKESAKKPSFEELLKDSCMSDM